jgi:hypothetical protein
VYSFKIPEKNTSLEQKMIYSVLSSVLDEEYRLQAINSPNVTENLNL